MRQMQLYWKGRPKRWSRRLARDLRAASPVLAIFVCIGMTASVIAATESIPRGNSEPEFAPTPPVASPPPALERADAFSRFSTDARCARSGDRYGLSAAIPGPLQTGSSSSR